MTVVQAADPVLGDPDPSDMRLLRYPDIHGDTIVFSYAGDLWTVSAQGGQARRLTGSVGYQSQAKFSPDGQTIAFSGNYDGNNDVYLIPAGGGEPVRLTWHPGWDRVIDWQPDGKSVRFQSPRAEPHRPRPAALHRVDRRRPAPAHHPAHGRPVQLLARRQARSPSTASPASTAPGNATRAAWPRTSGSTTSTQNDTQQITDWIGSDNFPMWHGDTIYYNSDQTGRLQIWAHDLTTGEQRQVTDHDEYDVKYPSLGPGAIVYENGGWLYVLDLATEKTRKVHGLPVQRQRADPADHQGRSATGSAAATSPPTPSGPSSTPAATSSPCPPRRATSAT